MVLMKRSRLIEMRPRKYLDATRIRSHSLRREPQHVQRFLGDDGGAMRTQLSTTIEGISRGFDPGAIEMTGSALDPPLHLYPLRPCPALSFLPRLGDEMPAKKDRPPTATHNAHSPHTTLVSLPDQEENGVFVSGGSDVSRYARKPTFFYW